LLANTSIKAFSEALCFVATGYRHVRALANFKAVWGSVDKFKDTSVTVNFVWEYEGPLLNATDVTSTIEGALN